VSEKIKMTIEGVEQLKTKLQELKKEFNENEKAMTASFKNSNGDGAHDNAEFEYLLSRERMLASQINYIVQKLSNIEIIENIEMDDDCVNIGDVVDINMIFGEDDEELMTVMLVGGESSGLDGKVSINSPLGKSMLGKKIGTTVSYEINNNIINVQLLEKVKNKCKKK